MEWDNIFEDYHRNEKKALPPEGHAQRFEQRLNRNKQKSPLRWWGIAASVALLMGIQQFTSTLPNHKALELEHYYAGEVDQKIKTIETRFGQQHTATIAEIKNKIAVLDREYQTLVERFENNHQHPRLMKAMTQNLAQRLQLLTELENKLSEQQHKNNSNATI